MNLYVGNHILNLDALTCVDLRLSWETEEWTYMRNPDGLLCRDTRRLIQHTGVRLSFVGGKSVTIEDLPSASADNLRDWLLANLPDLHDLNAQAAPTSLQDEIMAGLPAELRNLKGA